MIPSRGRDALVQSCDGRLCEGEMRQVGEEHNDKGSASWVGANLSTYRCTMQDELLLPLGMLVLAGRGFAIVSTAWVEWIKQERNGPGLLSVFSGF
jgi:hypothetical protein